MTLREISTKRGFAVPIAVLGAAVSLVSVYYLGQMSTAKADSDNKEFLMKEISLDREKIVKLETNYLNIEKSLLRIEKYLQK